MKRSDKMDFAVETAIVTLAGGAVILQIFMTFFMPLDSSYLKALLWFVPYILVTLLVGAPALLVFGVAFRLSIYLLDIAPLGKQVKLFLSILAGLALLILSENVYLNFRTIKGREASIIAFATVVSFVIPFLYWVLKRDIWDALPSRPKEDPNILDHFE